MPLSPYGVAKKVGRRLPHARTATSTSSSSPRSRSRTSTARVRTRTARRASSSIFAGAPAVGAAVHDLRRPATTPATSSSSTTSSTRSCAPRTRGGGLLVQHRHRRARPRSNTLYATMAAATGVADPPLHAPRPGRRPRPVRARSGPRRDPARMEALDDSAAGHDRVLDWLRLRARAAPPCRDRFGAKRPEPAEACGGRRGSAKTQRKRSSWGLRTISSRTELSRSHVGSTPRTTATGMPVDLPITSSAARRQLVGDGTPRSPASSRPRASGVPRRSSTPATPAQPMATSVRPRRQVRPNVSETIDADLDAGAGPQRRRGSGGPSGRSRAAAARPSPVRCSRGRRRRWRTRSRAWSR